jgi:hypothetical protein
MIRRWSCLGFIPRKSPHPSIALYWRYTRHQVRYKRFLFLPFFFFPRNRKAIINVFFWKYLLFYYKMISNALVYLVNYTQTYRFETSYWFAALLPPMPSPRIIMYGYEYILFFYYFALFSLFPQRTCLIKGMRVIMSPRLLKYYNHIFRKRSSIAPRYGYKLYAPHERAVQFAPLWARFCWKVNRKQFRSRGRRLCRFNRPRLFVPLWLNIFAWVADFYIFLPTRKPLLLLLSYRGMFFYIPRFVSLDTYMLVKIGSLASFNAITEAEHLGGFLFYAPNVSPLSCLMIKFRAFPQYILSKGSRGILIARDFRHYSSLLSLPSGARKLLSFWDISVFSPIRGYRPKYFYDQRAGFRCHIGRKCNTRGVAKNPVDHPHGGRTKAIAHPRSPWGWTTKLK